jgi:hypothetical protein
MGGFVFGLFSEKVCVRTSSVEYQFVLGKVINKQPIALN